LSSVIFGFAFQDIISVQSRSKQKPMQEAKMTNYRDTNKLHVAAKHLLVQVGNAVFNA